MEKDFIRKDNGFDYYKQLIFDYDRYNGILSSETLERKVSISGQDGRETNQSYDQTGNLVFNSESGHSNPSKPLQGGIK